MPIFDTCTSHIPVHFRNLSILGTCPCRTPVYFRRLLKPHTPLYFRHLLQPHISTPAQAHPPADSCDLSLVHAGLCDDVREGAPWQVLHHHPQLLANQETEMVFSVFTLYTKTTTTKTYHTIRTTRAIKYISSM